MILDTAGDSTDLKSIQEWIDHGDGFLLVYSINNLASFEYLENLIEKIHLLKNSKDTLILLVGNRCDLEEERKISKEEGKKFAHAHNALFIETSAKLGINVNNAFDIVRKRLI